VIREMVRYGNMQMNIEKVIKPLRQGSHRYAGSYDNRKRWYPNSEFRDIPGSFDVRPPSGSFPYAYLKHFYTTRYARMLAIHEPYMYMAIQGIDKNSEIGKMIIAISVMRQMGVEMSNVKIEIDEGKDA
jgi:hypothetical protein